MKNLFIILIIMGAFLQQNCVPKEKPVDIKNQQDSTIIVSTVIDNSTTNVDSIKETNLTNEVEDIIKKEIKATEIQKTNQTNKSEVISSTSIPTTKVEPKKDVVVKPTEPIKTETSKDVTVISTPKEITTNTPVAPKETSTITTEENTTTMPVAPKVSSNSSTWVVPDNFKKMKNPLTNTNENMSEAKIVYNIHCKSCHGSKGLGDGTKAKGLKGDLGDFSSAKFHAQTDGDLFYKTKIGREDMPGYAKKLTDEEIWLTVLFMRSLKK